MAESKVDLVHMAVEPDSHDWVVSWETDDDIYVSRDNFDENQLPIHYIHNYLISGRGDKKSELCGTVESMYHSNGGHYKAKVVTCTRQGCPICFRNWAKRLGRRSANYLFAIADKESFKLYHSVLQIQNIYQVHNLNFSELINETLRPFHSTENGEFGVSWVFHPYSIRCSNPKCKIYKLERGKHGSKLPKKCPQCGELYPWVWEYHPHLHLITNFYVDFNKHPNFQDDLKKQGMVYHNISQDERSRAMMRHLPENEIPKGYIDTLQHLENVLTYEAGHARYEYAKSKQVIVHTGLFARINWKMHDQVIKTVATDENNDPYKKVFHKALGNNGNSTITKVLKCNGQPWYVRDEFGEFIYLYEYVHRITIERRRYPAKYLSRSSKKVKVHNKKKPSLWHQANLYGQTRTNGFKVVPKVFINGRVVLG